MVSLKSIKDISDLKGKKVLVRVDFNVPFRKRKIKDDTRIKAALPTIKYLREKGAIVVLVAHLGRPGKKAKPKKAANGFFWQAEKALSLKPVARRLQSLLGKKVVFVPDCLAGRAEIEKAKAGAVFLLENVRFYAEEEENKLKFGKALAEGFDYYVNDAFSVCHRRHASLVAVTRYLPSYAGFLVEAEIKNLSHLISRPRKPYVAVFGGAKLSTKTKILEKLFPKLDKILIGGALANVFFAAEGRQIGKSFVEKKMVPKAKRLLQKSKGKIVLPIDVAVAKSKGSKAKPQIKNLEEILASDLILDIGPQTVQFFGKEIEKSKTILWNGPMGMFELRQFSSGSLSLAKIIALTAEKKPFGVCGGGETVEVLKKTHLEGKMDWVSTGGGAMMAFLSGEEMPGIKPLLKK